MKLIFWIFLLLFPVSILAHQKSVSFLRIEKSQASYKAQLYVTLSDLDGAIGLDINHNNKINELEVKQRERVINQYILSKISVRKNDIYCSLQINAYRVQRFNFGIYLSVPLIINCKNTNDKLQVSYHIFQDIYPSHQGIITYISPNNELTKVMNRENSVFLINDSITP